MLRYFWTATQKDRIRDTCTKYNLPSKVKERIISTVELLDSYYGVGRSMNDDGGCVILIIDDDVSRAKQAYEEVLKKYHTCEAEREFQDILYSDRQEEYYADLYIVSHFSYILSEKDCAKKLCESKKMDL